MANILDGDGVTLGAATPANLFTTPNTGAIFGFRFINNTGGEALVTASKSTVSATIQTAGRVLPDSFAIQDGGFYEATGMTVGAGRFFVVESDTAGVTCVPFGLEGA